MRLDVGFLALHIFHSIARAQRNSHLEDDVFILFPCLAFNYIWQLHTHTYAITATISSSPAMAGHPARSG
jgi:hypothetical protein